jgi:hypothetical protein
MRAAEIRRKTVTLYARITTVIIGCISFYWALAAQPAPEQPDARVREQAWKTVASVPRLFRERSFTCATLAEAVNHFVVIREDSALTELDTLASGKISDFTQVDLSFSVAERIGWMCRVLYDPKGQKPLRQPGFGGLFLPWRSMPLEKWPLYPVALSGATYFVLSEGYALDGVAEDPKHYIAYCRENGIFRKTPVRVPTRDQALKDATTLRQSEAWKSIKWQDSGPGFRYTMSEEWTCKFIRGQAESTPAR